MTLKSTTFRKSIRIKPDVDTILSEEGTLKVDSSDNKLKAYLGAAIRALVSEDQSQTLTNKTIVVANNTITTAASGNLAATELNTALSELQSDIDTRATGSALTGHTSASSGVHGVVGSVVGTSDAQALTNKTIDADLNTITNIENADIKAGAAIARNKLASGTANRVAVNDGSGVLSDAAAITASRALISDANGIPTHSSVTSTTLAFLDATSSVQTQIDTKVTGPASSTNSAIARYDGTTGKLVKNSGALLSDTAEISGVTALTVDNLYFDGNTVETLNLNGNIDITPNGTGIIDLNKDSRFFQDVAYQITTDSTTTGADATLVDPATKIIRLTNASLASLTMIPAGSQGQQITLINHTGAIVTIKDNSGATAANRILTGQKASISLKDEASLILEYDSTESRWMVIGGTGSGNGSGINYITNSDMEAGVTGYVAYAEDLITNGTFDSNISGWTADAGTISFSSNTLLLNSASTYGAFYQSLSVQVGTTYSVSCTYTKSEIIRPVGMRLWNSSGGIIASGDTLTAASGSLTLTFTATTSSIRIGAYHDRTVASTSNFDNFIMLPSIPVDGTGGSPNVTVTATTTTPLRGAQSLLFTKDAVNRQGQGFSFDFTIANADKNQLLDINFEYEIPSGTYASGDMGVFIYDVTNATLIQPIQIDIPGLSSGNTGRFQSQFQSTGSTSYRLIAHVRTTSASAYTVEVDTVRVSPSQSFVGTIVTDPVSWTPTGSMTTNTTYTGKWWRSGKFMEGYIKLDFTGAPNSTSLTVNLPSGYSIDTSSLLTAGASNSFTLGYGNFLDTGSNDYVALSLEYSSTTALAVKVFRTASIANVVDTKQAFTQAVPVTVANTDVMNLYFKVPIQGWTSANAATQGFGVVPSFRATLPASDQTVSTTAATKVNFNTSVYDTTGSFNTSTQRYTIPETGTYLITAQIYFALLTANDATSIALYVDGSLHSFNAQPNASTSYGLPYSTQLRLNKGQYIEIFTDSASDTNYLIEGAAAGRSWFSAARIDKNMFGMNQVVFASYTTNAGQTVNSTPANLIYEDKVRDTHNAYNTSTGVFTAPVDGIYTINATMGPSTNLGTSQNQFLRINVNGSIMLQNAIAGSGVANERTTMAIHTVYLNAGDTVAVLCYSDVSTTLVTTSYKNVLTITKEN